MACAARPVPTPGTAVEGKKTRAAVRRGGAGACRMGKRLVGRNEPCEITIEFYVIAPLFHIYVFICPCQFQSVTAQIAQVGRGGLAGPHHSARSRRPPGEGRGGGEAAEGFQRGASGAAGMARRARRPARIRAVRPLALALALGVALAAGAAAAELVCPEDAHPLTGGLLGRCQDLCDASDASSCDGGLCCRVGCGYKCVEGVAASTSEPEPQAEPEAEAEAEAEEAELVCPEDTHDGDLVGRCPDLCDASDASSCERGLCCHVWCGYKCVEGVAASTPAPAPELLLEGGESALATEGASDDGAAGGEVESGDVEGSANGSRDMKPSQPSQVLGVALVAVGAVGIGGVLVARRSGLLHRASLFDRAFLKTPERGTHKFEVIEDDTHTLDAL